MKRLSQALTLLTLALLANLSHSAANSTDKKREQKWYRVEVIIFTQKDGFNDELSSRDIVLSFPPQLIDLDNNTHGYTALPDSDRALNADARSLQRTGQYKVLFHRAWRQPGLAPANSPWINIHQVAENTALNGSLRVYLSSYLHMESHLWHVSYSPESLSPTSGQLAPKATNPAIAATMGNLQTLPETEALQLNPWPLPPTSPLMASAPNTPDQPLKHHNAINQALLGQVSATPPATINDKQPLNTAVIDGTPRGIDEIILLKQASRLTLNKLHYFDHPKMGILVTVSRDTTAIGEVQKQEHKESID